LNEHKCPTCGKDPLEVLDKQRQIKRVLNIMHSQDTALNPSRVQRAFRQRVYLPMKSQFVNGNIFTRAIMVIAILSVVMTVLRVLIHWTMPRRKPLSLNVLSVVDPLGDTTLLEGSESNL